MTNQLAVLTVLGFAGLAGTPAAATLCVDPTGAAGCRTTIQAAVDAAGGGDLILVAPGVYFESVVVPSGKDGLRIVGTRRDTTIVDASPYSDRGITGDDPAFLVQSSNVVLRALTVRNGSTGVQIEGPGVVLDTLAFRGADRAVVILALRAEVRGSIFHACQECVSIQGSDAVVRDNTFSGGTINVGLDEFTDAHRPVVSGNRISGGRRGIFLEANDATARANDVRYQLTGGILVSGDNPIVNDNTVVGAGLGLTGMCVARQSDDRPAVCTRASVARNTVVSTRTYGLQSGSTGPGLVTQLNAVSRTLTGMTLGAGPAGTVIPFRVERNRVTRAGLVIAPPNDFGGHCIETFGSGVRLAGNRVARCTDAGFYVQGHANVLQDNTITRAAGDGITVDGANFVPAQDTRLIGNVARNNAAQGIAIINGALRTTLTGNTALSNRVDFCDEGVQTLESGNMFGTRGPCAVRH